VNRSSNRLTRTTIALVIAALVVGTLMPVTAWAATGLQHAFSDTASTPSEADFDLLAALRLLLGDTGFGGPARPADPLTRAEFAALALRMRGLMDQAAPLAAMPPAFVDAASIPEWAWGYVNAAHANGLVNGYEDGSFRAAAPVRLAEAIAIMARLLDRADELSGALAWPDSYLELGGRIGLAGRYTGYGNIQLDRAAIAHVAARALVTDLDATGSGRSLLTERYGYSAATLESIAPDGLVTEAGTMTLADPYLRGDLDLELHEGHGVAAQWLTLPSTGEVAFVAAVAAGVWQPVGTALRYDDQPGTIAVSAAQWWRETQAITAATAPPVTATGTLRTARIRLASPNDDGAVVEGAVLVAGTTTASKLMVRDNGSDAPWIAIDVDAQGRFHQLVYLTRGRGSYTLQLLTPAAQAGYYYPDLSFAVNNQLHIVADPQLGAMFAWPRADVVTEVAGYVDVAGYVPAGMAYLQVKTGNEYMLQQAPTDAGYFAARVWLSRGAGDYTIRICVDDGDSGYYRLSNAIVNVRNAPGTPGEWSVPGIYVQSGNAAVGELARTIVATAGASGHYEQALAIYRWVIRNLAYDVARAGDLSAGQLTTTVILARGKGVCEDYANVFAALCRAVDIQTRVAVGRISGGTVSHAWNEFLAGGRWVSVDATWGAGYVTGGAFRPSPSDTWFDRDLVATHVREGVRSDWWPGEGN
jgi:hypothetical protein